MFVLKLFWKRCLICERRKKVLTIGCCKNKYICRLCLKRWRRRSTICPYCRNDPIIIKSD